MIFLSTVEVCPIPIYKMFFKKTWEKQEESINKSIFNTQKLAN